MATTDNVPAIIPAEELSPEDRQAASEAAFALQERVKEGMAAGRQALWILASALYEFEETAGWLALGYEKKSDWLADPEIQLTRSTYNRLVRAWRSLVVEREIDPGSLKELDASKIEIVLPRVEKGEVTMESALDDVKTLGFRDLREAYFKPKLGRPKAEVVDVGPAEANVPAGAPSSPVDETDDDTGPTDQVEEADAQEASETPESVGNVVDEEAMMRRYDARKAAEEAMQAWTVNRTDKTGNSLYTALQMLLEFV
jgi:hypothetical protein